MVGTLSLVTFLSDDNIYRLLWPEQLNDNVGEGGGAGWPGGKQDGRGKQGGRAGGGAGGTGPGARAASNHTL